MQSSYDRTKQYPGFTIVELLIVLVIIGILAALVVVAYNGIQERARASTASSALTQTAKKIALWQVDNPGTAPDCATFISLLSNPSGSTCTGTGVTSHDTAYQYTAGTNGAYCITATVGPTSYYLNTTTATKPTEGGCNGHGQGGVVPITNLAVNPSVESDTSGWAARWYGGNGGAGTTARTSTSAYTGSSGYRKTWTTSGNGQDVGYQFTALNIVVGKTYTFSVYMRSSVSTKYKRWLIWQDSSGTNLNGASVGTETAINANTWGRLTVSGTAPTNASQVVFVFGPYPDINISYASGDTLDADAVMITEGSSPYIFADGNSSNWIWNGTPNNSTSTGPPM